MNTTLSIILIILSTLIVIAILLQQSGKGLSATFGGNGSFYQTKRGFEKFLFRSTIALGVLIIVVSISYILFA